MADKKKPSTALESAALADQLKGLITGRSPVSSLIKAINIFKRTKKAEGGEVKKYMGGGEVEVAMDDSPNSGMITTKGWGKSRAT